MDTLAKIRIAALAVILPSSYFGAATLQGSGFCDNPCDSCYSENNCVDYDLYNCCSGGAYPEYMNCGQQGGAKYCPGIGEVCECHCDDC